MQAVYAPWLQRQRALRCCVCLVLGRYYNMLKLAPHRPSAEKGEKLSPFSGHHATSRYVASLHGVNEKTVRNTAEVAEVVIPSVPTTPTTRAPSDCRTLGTICPQSRGLMQQHGMSALCSAWVIEPCGTPLNSPKSSLPFHRFHPFHYSRPQPTVYRKQGQIVLVFRASCDRASTGRPAASEKGDNLSTFTAGTEVRSTHCVSCATMATRKSGKIYHLFGLRIARAADERYNGSVCCAAAYALSCPLRSLRFCCSRVLTPRSQSSITDVSA